MSDSGGGGGEAQAEDGSLLWGGTATAAAAAAEATTTTATDDVSTAEDEPEPGGSLTRVDSLTLALRAIQAGGFQHSQENSGNSLNSSGSSSGSQLEDEAARPSCKRASSLKLPGNRQQSDESCPDAATKKAVRFADAMGLDLALIRDVFDLESPPEIPPQAMRDLVLPPSDDEEEPAERDTDDSRGRRDQQVESPVHLYLSPSFAQPGSAPNFNSRITAQKVVLERAHFQQQTVASDASAASSASSASIVGGQVRGIVRVANIGFEKSVRIRASLDSWRSSFDVAADYVAGGGCGGSDQFSFTMSLPDWLRANDRVAFCVAYTVNGETYWDNNFGDNYAFHCVAVGHGPRHGLDQAWTRYD